VDGEPAVSIRLERYVRERFDPEKAGDVLLQLVALADSSGRSLPERVQAAAVLVADGDYEAFGEALALARIDWRDLLVAAGLAEEDWPAELDYRLGPD